MFALPESRATPIDVPIITDGYEVLHFDEVPILFTGLNKYRVRVLGSSVEEDYDHGVERFFHICVTSEDYSRFVHREVSYRELLRIAGSIFVIDRFVDDRQALIYAIAVSEIPEDYLPHEDSFCPPLESAERQLASRYRLALGGRWSLDVLSHFPKLYAQVYSAFSIAENPELVMRNSVQDVLKHHPWRGGFSAVNLYKSLHTALGKRGRPVVMAMQYASPGFIELALDPSVAARMRETARAFLADQIRWESLYRQDYRTMQARGLLKGRLEVSLGTPSTDADDEDAADFDTHLIEDQPEEPPPAQADLRADERLTVTPEDVAFLERAAATMTELLGPDLTTPLVREADNPVVAVKVLHSLYRRLRDLSRYEERHLVTL